jgi:hypothetical protein
VKTLRLLLIFVVIWFLSTSLDPGINETVATITTPTYPTPVVTINNFIPFLLFIGSIWTAIKIHDLSVRP